MKQIFLVTGNKNKLAEWRRLLPTDISIDSLDVDLAEIQSTDPEEIVADKAKRAFEVTGKPVVVEDVSASLSSLNGLPGPFIKFFIKALGEDALYTLSNKKKEPASVSCSIAYYDGVELIIVTGVVEGSVVASRGGNGFGFDKTFVPNGEIETYAQMSSEKKDSVSHRSKAVRLFVEALEARQS